MFPLAAAPAAPLLHVSSGRYLLVTAPHRGIIGPNRQNQIVGLPLFGTTVESNRGIQPDEIGVSLFGRVSPLVPIGASACHHFSMTLEDVIDLLRGIVMVRYIRAAGCEVHDEQAHHLVGCREF